MAACICNIKDPDCPDLGDILDMDEEDKIRELNKIEEDFAWLSHGAMRGCVGAIDGLAIKIGRPRVGAGEGRVVDPASYRNRKGFFAYNMQGVVDRNSRFRNVSIKTPGCTGDSMAHAVSDLGLKMQEDEKLLTPYWLVGDDAYGASEQMIVPWPGRGLADDKDSFNFYQSRMRIRVVGIMLCCSAWLPCDPVHQLPHVVSSSFSYKRWRLGCWCGGGAACGNR